MDDFELAGIAVACSLGFVWVYSIVRLTWRLWRGDVESAGRDGDTWRGRLGKRRRQR